MKISKPTSPGRRGMTGIDFRAVLTRKKPLKSATHGFKRHVGRNSAGRITTRHKGGGVKRRYRDVSFNYNKKDIPARIESIEYDPNRTSFINLVVYSDGYREYRLGFSDARVGGKILISKKAKVASGNAMPIGLIPVGTQVYNIELKSGSGGKIARSAGEYAEIVAHEGGLTLLKMPSKELRRVSSLAWASIGSLSKSEHRFMKIGKAGRSRYKGIRPTVRGSAMNPVDHPYGGGEGKAPQGTRRPKNKWGKGTRGVKTRRKKKYSNKLIVSRRIKTKRKK